MRASFAQAAANTIFNRVFLEYLITYEIFFEIFPVGRMLRPAKHALNSAYGTLNFSAWKPPHGVRNLLFQILHAFGQADFPQLFSGGNAVVVPAPQMVVTIQQPVQVFR